MPLTNFPNGVTSFGVPVLSGMSMPFTGDYYFVDPVNGSDGNRGTDTERPFKTLYKGHAACTAGNNDVVFLIGNGATTGTARLSVANAVLVDSTATTGTLTWSKNSTHLIGISAPSANVRARMAPETADTLALFGSGNLVSVTASGCTFANFSVYHGFATGGASQIAWTDSGGRNSYNGVQIMGGGDTASSTTNVATMRSLLVSGSTGEHQFIGCTIGLDTLARSAGGIEMEFSGGSPRNRFENCTIETNAGAAGCFWMKVGVGGIDRYALFRNCAFTNPIGSGATSMTTGFSMDASPGGNVLLQNCLVYGATKTDTAQKTYTNTANAASLGGAVVATST